MVASSLFIDRSAIAEDPALRAEREDAWEATLSGLPTRERCVVVLYCRHGLTHHEIGVVLGIGESRVCQIYRQTLAELRDSGNYQALQRN